MPKIKLKLSNCLLAFRQNDKIHESGYNCFDLAYYDPETKEYYEISEWYCDHISFNRYHSKEHEIFGINMDTKDGWIRAWADDNTGKMRNTLKWSFPMSTTWVQSIEDPEEILEAEIK